MKNKLFRFCITFMTATVLCAGVAEAGFWGRLFGKEDKAEAVPQQPASQAAAAGSQSAGAQTAPVTKPLAGASTAAAAGVKLDTQSALATVASVKSALSSIATNGSQLRTLLGDRPELQGLLDKALDAAKKGDDLLALDQIKAIGEAASLSADQKKLVGDLKKDFEVLALGRNFPEDGPVGNAITQIKSGDYTKAVATLGDMAKDSSLTDTQRSILTKIIQQYAGDFKRLLPF